MASKRQKITFRQVRPTLLVVGEGDSDVAFLKHLKKLYCSGIAVVNVTIRNAHGKGPEHVINYTKRQQGAYDQRAAFLDTDLPWPKVPKKIATVGSKPCLEGLLLSICGKCPPKPSDDCKEDLRDLLGDRPDPTEAKFYDTHFPKSLLNTARSKLPALDKLLKLFEGDWSKETERADLSKE